MVDNHPLKGKVALVNGSSRNIGRTTALLLASKGTYTVVNLRSNEKESQSVRDAILENGGI